MTTVLEQAQAVRSGYWSLRERIKLLDGNVDHTTTDVVISVLDDMYAVVGKDDLHPYMTIRLQTPVGYDLGLRMCALIDKIPQTDPRRAEQALKLISVIQTPDFDPSLYPIDKGSIDPINRAIALLDPADPRRTDEALAHIDRIVNDPKSERALKNSSYYYGNHGYLYHPNRSRGVAQAVNLLPEGSDVKIGEAIRHLKYLAGEGADRMRESGADLGIRSKEAAGLIHSMLELVPPEQHRVVLEMVAEDRFTEIIEEYESGVITASETASALATGLSILPERKLDAEESGILIMSMSFAQATQERHPLMLEPDEHGRERAGGWRLASLWQQIALRTQAQEIVTTHVTARSGNVTFHPQGRRFNFGESAG